MDKYFVVTYDFRRHLLNEFQTRATARPSYSFRAFAKFLGLDSSTLRKIVSGKRPLGERLIQKLGARLNMSKEELQHYVEAQRIRRRTTPLQAEEIKAQHQILTAHEFSRVSRICPYAILELMDVEGFQGHAEWIAQALGLPVTEVREAIAVLFELGWVESNAEGAWTKKVLRTTTNTLDPEIALIRHRLISEISEKCNAALQSVPRARRSHSAMTFSLDHELLPEAIEKIRAFRMDMVALKDRSLNKDSVYQIFVGLYPLTGVE